jgi:hypothetical protein
MNNKEIKAFFIDRFHKRTWDKNLGRKKEYYIEEFNTTYNHHQKACIGNNISLRDKMFIAQLRTNSHQIRCEPSVGKDQRKIGKKECMFFTFGKVETEKHFIFVGIW